MNLNTASARDKSRILILTTQNVLFHAGSATRQQTDTERPRSNPARPIENPDSPDPGKRFKNGRDPDLTAVQTAGQT
jgi:hypothetical protein